MFSELFSTIQTVSERNLILTELDIAKDALFKEEVLREKILNTQLRAQTAQFIKGLLAHPQREQLLEECKRAVGQLPTIELTISVVPTIEMIHTVHEWLRENVGDCVIDFRVDQSLIAGAKIAYKGKYFDGSIRKPFAELMQKKFSR